MAFSICFSEYFFGWDFSLKKEVLERPIRELFSIFNNPLRNQRLLFSNYA